GEAREIGGAEPLLPLAVQDVHGGVLGGDRLGPLPRPVRGGVVDDEHIRLGHGGAQARERARQRLALVVGGDDHERARQRGVGGVHGHRPRRRRGAGASARSRVFRAPSTPSSASTLRPTEIHGPAATDGVMPVRSGTSASSVPCSQWSTKSMRRPSKLKIADSPTVETCTTLRPDMTAMTFAWASCWIDSCEWPNRALLDWTTMSSAPSSTTSWTRPS